MMIEEAALQDAEDNFWAEGGISDQMSDQVSEHIKAHRQVTSYSFSHQMSIKEIHEQESHMQNTGQYRDFVSFSAYPEDYRNNLDEVAIEGRIQIKSPKQDFFGGMSKEVRKDYESEILDNPTWLDLCLCANDMINCTGDNHHIFLEAVHKTGSFTLDDESFVLIYDFSMGS